MWKRKRGSTYLEWLVAKLGSWLAGINNQIFHTYKPKVTARTVCIKQYFRLEWIKDGIHQGWVDPMVSHSSKTWH